MMGILVAALMFCTGSAASAPAPGRSETGFTVALRAGWAKPLGTLAGDADRGNRTALDTEFGPGLSLAADGGYRLGHGLTLGAYVQYAFVRLNPSAGPDVCSSAATECTDGRDLRIGALVTFHLPRIRPVTPWFGLGAGYEWARYDVSAPTGRGTITYKGIELLDLQVGGDFSISPRLSAGPFASLSFARFGAEVFSPGGASVSLDLSQRRVHHWLLVGGRVRCDL